MRNSQRHDSTIEALRKQLEEAEAARQAEEKAELAAIRRAQRAAGESHTRLVLDLYDLLGVEPEHPSSRVVKGHVREVAVDRAEELRTQRLYDLIEGLAAAAPEALTRLKEADETGREERRPESKAEVADSAGDSAAESDEGGIDEAEGDDDEDVEETAGPSAWVGDDAASQRYGHVA